MENDTVQGAVAKVISVWTAVGITSWSEAAAMVAFFYTLLLIGEWFYKKWKARKSCQNSTPNS